MFHNRSNPIQTQQQPSQNATTGQQNHTHELEAINEQKRANTISVISNKLARNANKLIIWSLVINALLFMATIVVFAFNIKAINAASRSADAADSAVAEQKRNDFSIQQNKIVDDGVNARRQKYNDSVSNVARQITLTSIKTSDSISKENLRQQINSLNETKMQFEKEHSSILNLSEINVEQFEKNKQTIIRFKIENLTNQPIVTNKATLHIIITDSLTGINADTIKSYFVNPTFTEQSLYASVNSPIEATEKYPNFPDFYYNAISNKEAFFFIWGYFKYTNLVTNKPHIYKFYVRMDLENKKHFFYLNDNL